MMGQSIKIKKISLSPAQATMASFLVICLVGTFLLMLPITHVNGQWLDPVTALFMSVSATCVTGLAVVDIGKDFSIWGQIIILVLMQVGGLSYMTFTSIFIYMTGKKLSYSDTKIFDMSNNSDGKINFADFVIKIGLLTFSIEFVGFLFLLKDSLEALGPLDFSNLNLIAKGVFQAVFHAVSAFCNAGLSLYSGSLEGFRHNYWMLWMFSLLPILGGLGYTVLNEIYAYIVEYTKARANKKPIFRPSLHTRVSLWVTFSLLLVGVLTQFVLIYAQDLQSIVSLGLEGPAKHFDNFATAFFQSVASRSSGFNSIPLTELGDPSLIFLIVWMFIGACPGGTGGGIKVTTLFIVFAMMWSALKNDDEVKIFDRSINSTYQTRSLIVFSSTVIMIIFFTWLISIFEADKGLRFIDEFFEVCSAFTTVGLSTGITGKLSDPSLIVLCLCMYIGRPGPLLFLMSLIPEDVTSKPSYPEEGILVG